MQFRKIVFAWVVFALTFAQFAIAWHSVIHPDHGFEGLQAQQQASLDHEHSDENPSRSHKCPECFLVKSLQTAFYFDSIAFVDVALSAQDIPPVEIPYVRQGIENHYNPRAPPAFLI